MRVQPPIDLNTPSRAPQGLPDGRRVADAPRFGLMGAGSADRAMGWVVQNLYDKGEAYRYAVEQTVGYTIPRTAMQLNRTRSITGESNPMAAKEMLTRDLAADFTDTFLPGLLATWGIGRVLDSRNKTFVASNMGHDAYTLYESLSRNPQGGFHTRSQFFKAMENTLKQAAQHPSQASFGLENLVANLGAHSDDKLSAAAQKLASKLNLKHLDLDLAIPQSSRKLSVTMPELLRDLSLIHQKAPKAPAASWGKSLAAKMTQSRGMMKYQMLGNMAALLASVSIPFGIRLMTRRHYGIDAFPGTKELAKHFQKKEAGNAQPAEQKEKPNARFVLFPYLKESLKDGNALPSLLTAGFFGVLGGAVLRRFSLAGRSVFKPADWTKVYAFQRGFPFTTVAQMELTYGALCGIRLAASRDQDEFREAGIRDCLLGWPTLTYFFPWFRNKLGGVFNQTLSKRFGSPNLLMKPNGEVRAANEIHASQLGNLKLSKPVEQAVQETKLYQTRITFASAATSWLLLAVVEPMLGIWMTNRFATKRLQQTEPEAPPVAPATPPAADAQKTSTASPAFNSRNRFSYAPIMQPRFPAVPVAMAYPAGYLPNRFEPYYN